MYVYLCITLVHIYKSQQFVEIGILGSWKVKQKLTVFTGNIALRILLLNFYSEV